jgi:hypothetical protein
MGVPGIVLTDRPTVCVGMPRGSRHVIGGDMSGSQLSDHSCGAALGQDAECFSEVAQLGAWPQAGKLEQVSGDDPGTVVGVGEFGGELFGLLQVVDGFAEPKAHFVLTPFPIPDRQQTGLLIGAPTD